MKSIKKTADCIRNSQNCKCYAYCRSCKRGLEAKTARESSHRLFLKGARSEHIANRTGNRATRASNNDNLVCALSRLGGQKSEVFDRKYPKSFFKTTSLRLHFDFTSISLRLHFDFTSTSLRCHFDFTSTSLRLHFGFSRIRLRFHFDFTSTSLV